MPGGWTCRPNEWPEEERENLRAVVATLKGVKRAYLVDRSMGDPAHDHSCLIMEHQGGLINPKAVRDGAETYQAATPLVLALVRQAPREVQAVPNASFSTVALPKSSMAKANLGNEA